MARIPPPRTTQSRPPSPPPIHGLPSTLVGADGCVQGGRACGAGSATAAASTAVSATRRSFDFGRCAAAVAGAGRAFVTAGCHRGGALADRLGLASASTAADDAPGDPPPSPPASRSKLPALPASHLPHNHYQGV